MADLYVANCSKQDHDFTFTLPEKRNHDMVKIRAGDQVRLKGISPEGAKAIIEHHEVYGMRSVARVQKEQGFVGLCYSDEPIKLSGIMGAIEHNMEELKKEGEKLRDVAAIAADQSLLNSGIDSSDLKSTIVEVRELESRDRPDTEVNETRTVKPEPGQTDRRGKQNPARLQGGPSR
jgi:hypothetical protein